ncbi:glycosyltransferase [Flavihumibacter sp. CACIAM 22H1]|uniref:glycosyltransferase n=1 Tax=Flavihumibacter sp. CACIAM 22H1 TaxID=1812911 RepID=UPI0007A88995|nr:glycosyltransferase [Flavihumibacter sp. CACIAM 22H1]KYP14656.1 MAG: hypothetical protein A1D16_05020 [Flavihumibacter sp. CACIAM 22H1]
MEWGLGHASRCLPLLNYLLNNCGADMFVAANGPQAALIAEAFPGIRIIHPPGYQIKYHKNRAGTIARLAFSLPQLAQQIKAENQWLRAFAERQPVDAIISDNRYGFWHPEISSYLITHQLQVKTAFGKSVDSLVRKQLYQYINKFTACWVPDFEAMENSLAGELSHPSQLPGIPVQYIGPLTRMQPVPAAKEADTLFNFPAATTPQIQLLAILSGPEPQRTLLETSILEQWKNKPGSSLWLVRGLPDQHKAPAVRPDLRYLPNLYLVNHLSGPLLSEAITRATCILTRSGYSSVMDLVPHHKNLWMIPTPGQTEQEYLATYLQQKGLIQTVRQDKFSLQEILFYRSGASRPA